MVKFNPFFLTTNTCHLRVAFCEFVTQWLHCQQNEECSYFSPRLRIVVANAQWWRWWGQRHLSAHAHNDLSCTAQVVIVLICAWDVLFSSQFFQKGQMRNMEIQILGKMLFHGLGTFNRVPWMYLEHIQQEWYCPDAEKLVWGLGWEILLFSCMKYIDRYLFLLKIIIYLSKRKWIYNICVVLK